MPSKSKKNAKPKNNASSSVPPETLKVPADFANILVDFTRDLSITFPEYKHLWEKWTTLEMPESEVKNVFEYCITVLPERFFDILYQNDDIFKSESTTNTIFLPGVDFKLLYNCDNVSEKTHQSIWKYLQVLLLSAISAVKDKTNFGDAMNMFDGVSEDDLQEKLKETMESLNSFFKASGIDSDDDDEAPEGIPLNGESDGQSGPDFENFAKSFNFDNMSGSAEDLHDHLKGLFDGKIGSLAKEMAEEIAKDLGSILGEDGENITSTQDFLKKMIRNPKKLMDLMKTVSAKLSDKMKSGDISQDELMKEAGEWMGKMKGMGGADQFGEVFKNMAKNMGGLGKNTKLDMNAMTRMLNKNATKERMAAKLEKKKEAKLQATETPNNFVFRMEGQETQEKSAAVKPDLDQIMQEFGLSNDIIATNQPTAAPKKKKNKGKK
uniref:Uncharacterized protein n=1 Tax=viral metagenome TaxID=1070528 RepID=A0A6C0K1I2_9ZZZZ